MGIFDEFDQVVGNFCAAVDTIIEQCNSRLDAAQSDLQTVRATLTEKED